MSIFMDRHDVSEAVTAEIVAQIHQEDLKIQDQYSCRGLTYWFDDHRKTAFCLIEAPDADAIRKMHAKAHGDVPHRVIEVDASLVESFLGRIEDPVKAQNTALNIINDPAFRIIMVISLNGVPAPSKSDQLKSSLKCHNNAILELLKSYEGGVVKQSENHFLISFKSVTKAVRAAVEIQLLLNEFQDKMAGRLNLKIGLSTGVPVSERNLIFEDAIKLAERMCRIVQSEVIIGSEVKELYDSENANALNQDNIFCLTKQDERFLTLLMDYLESTWTNTNLKVDDFSKPVGCSKSQLYRKLILLTGKSPNTFIKDYRLDEALILLNKGNRNISEIAFETGFNSPSYFSKCFQKRYNFLPSSYLAE
ncbi:nickel-binding protein [Mucilaginibacter sp. McL0603]|uniref:nickel-binding protein n=1 Tax=Mucilaginibacter sp. McL0603 TaxID=3415670 RepID=UPI003CF3E4F7